MLTRIVCVVFPWLLKLTLRLGAKAFRKKYPPEKHAKLSRRYMWENYWQPLIEHTGRTKNQVDDVGGDFIYWFIGGYLDDTKLSNYLDSAREAVRNGDTTTALNAIAGAKALIAMPTT